MVGYDAHWLGGDGGQPLCQWGAMPADYDNDGDFDLLQILIHGGMGTDEGHTTILTNLGPSEGHRLQPDLDRIDWGFSTSSHRGDRYAAWFDMDLDGRLDIAVTQGGYEDAHDRLFLLLQRDDGQFVDVSGAVGLRTLGVGSTHALTVLDYDLDGDDDVLCALQLEANRLVLLESSATERGGHIAVKLQPPAGVNGSAVGARVKVTTGDLVQTREVFAGQGHFNTQAPFILNFGLGGRAQVDRVEVTWPGVAEPDVYEAPPLGELITLPHQPEEEPGPEGCAGCAGIDSAGRGAGLTLPLGLMLVLTTGLRRRRRG